MFSVSLSMSALFRLVGAIAATPTHAQAYAATTILVLIITSGFAIIRSEWQGSAAGSEGWSVYLAGPATMTLLQCIQMVQQVLRL